MSKTTAKPLVGRTIIARGHGWTVRRRGKRVTVAPAPMARLRHPQSRAGRFRVDDVRYVEVRQPGWWRPGWVHFAFEVPDPGVAADEEQPGVVVSYGRRHQSEFTHLIAAGGWRAVVFVR